VMAIMAANRAEAALDGAALGVIIVALALFGLWSLLP
jgi:hypothetical protein